ncbi:MAG: TIM barrel protein, partial [Burkholderiales bacterium]
MSGFASDAPFPPYGRVLDEIAQAGYEGTELGDWGFLPTDPEVLNQALRSRGLSLVGALVPWPLADAAMHKDAIDTALRTARLLASAPASDEARPFVILADDNGADATRTSLAGRIRPEHGLTPAQWKTFAAGAAAVARAVRDETGLRTVVHHHCAGFVETPEETDRFLDLTDPGLVGLCFDTGHYAYAGGDALAGLKRYGDRAWHVHFK